MLLTGPVGTTNGCPVKQVAVGESITFRIQSPVGTYNGLPATILLDRMPEQTTTEIGVSHTNPLTAQVVAETYSLKHVGMSYTLTVPQSFAGWSYVVQGMVLGYSPKTGLSFTMTDGHILVVSSGTEPGL